MCDDIERFGAPACRTSHAFKVTAAAASREREGAQARDKEREGEMRRFCSTFNRNWLREQRTNFSQCATHTHTTNKRMRTASAVAAADLLNYYVLFHYLSLRNVTPKTNGNISFEIKRWATAASVECSDDRRSHTKIIKQKRHSNGGRKNWSQNSRTHTRELASQQQ